MYLVLALDSSICHCDDITVQMIAMQIDPRKTGVLEVVSSQAFLRTPSLPEATTDKQRQLSRDLVDKHPFFPVDRPRIPFTSAIQTSISSAAGSAF